MSPKLNPVMDFIGRLPRRQNGFMHNHVIDQAIYALVAISAVLAVWAVAVWFS
jgi:hypothetical protein